MPVTPTPGAPPPGPPRVTAGPPPKGPGLFRQATSTTGGLVAVIVAACLAALLVLGFVAAGVFVGTRLLAHHRQDVVQRVDTGGQGQLPPGQRKKLQRQGPSDGQGMPGFPGGPGNGPGNGMGNGMGNGIGSLMGGAAGLGSVQHGELTVQGADGKATTMTLQRGTVTAASATSVTVKSDDGFTATYAVSDTTRGVRAGLAKGDTVLVVADKASAKAVLIRATRES